MAESKTRKKKILVLGGEGFIGKNILQRLSLGHKCFSLATNESIFSGENEGYEFIRGNPYREKIHNECEVVVHLIDNRVKTGNFVKEEMKLSRNSRIEEGVRLILFSSAVVYANPESDYGRRKTLLEEFYRNYCGEKGISLTIFRLFNVYGKYQLPYRQGSLVANIFYNYLKGKRTEINDLGAERDFMYASDVARFVGYAIENNAPGLIDLGTGKPVKIGEMIRLIENKVIRSKIEISYRENKENIFCPVAKNKLLNEVPPVSLEEGLRETFGFYKDNLSRINNYLKL